MNRFISLIKMMEKTKNKIITGDDSENKFVDIVLKIVLAVIVFGAVFYGGLKVAGVFEIIIEPFISLTSLLKILYMAFVVLTICLTIVSIINTLYMSDELMLIMTMPFTEVQIVAATIVREIKKALIISFCFCFPFGSALGIVLNEKVSFYFVLFISSIVLPVITVCIITSLVMILFRIFGIFRNRNFLRFFGVILLAAFYFAYAFITSGNDGSKNIFNDIAKLKGIVNYIPGIYYIGCLLDDFSIIPLLLLLAITLLSVIVVIILSKNIYLNTALSMKNCSGKSKKLSEKAYNKKNTPSNIITSIMKKEIKMTLRCPAYLINGYLITYLLPIIVIVMIVAGGKASEDISGIYVNLDNLGQLAEVVAISVLYTLFIAGSNTIVLTPVSREGNQMLLVKQMPLSSKTIIHGKIAASLLVTGIPTIGYMIVAGIIMVIMNVITVPCLIYTIIINCTVLITLININTFLDARRPNLNWSNETDMFKGKYIARFMWIILVIVLAIIAGAAIIILPSGFLAAIVILAINVVLDILSYLLVTRAGIKNI